MAILMMLYARFQRYRQPSRYRTLLLMKSCSTALYLRHRLKSGLSPMRVLRYCIWLIACAPGGGSHCYVPEVVGSLRLMRCCMSGP